MKRLSAFLCLVAVVVFFSCGRRGDSAPNAVLPDHTPYQYDSILVTYAAHPERALVLLDSAVTLGHVDAFNAQLIRATIYSKSLVEQRQDSAIRICENLLQHDSVKLNLENLDDVLNLLINTSRAKADDNEYLRWATRKANLCRKQNKEVELLRTESEIGMVMTHLGQVDEGLAMIDNSLQQLDRPGSVDRMDAYIIAAKRKISALNALDRPTEVIPLCQGILDRLDHYEHHAQQYAMDSYRLPWDRNPADRERYFDFYRAQAHGFMAIAYAHAGNKLQARKHLTAFNLSDYGHTFSARSMIVPAQMALGLYDDAMTTSFLIVQRMGADTINDNYARILRDSAIVAHARGHADEAYQLMNRHALLCKALSDSLHRSDAHEYAARYHAKDQQLKLQKAESENRQKTIIAVAIAILLVITTAAAVYLLRQRQHIAKKNRILVKIINENQLTLLDDNMVPEDAETDEHPADERKVVSPVSKEMFDLIDRTIRQERIYANSNLQRQDICDRFNLSRITLNNMLQQHRGNPSFPQFINAMRMEEAVKLLRESPDLSISAIAQSVGFSPANFRKQFLHIFGMTPLEFRQSL